MPFVYRSSGQVRTGMARPRVAALFVASCLLSIVSFYTTQQGMMLLKTTTDRDKRIFLLNQYIDGIRGYHDIKRYPEARLIPGLVLFRWDAPLFFANAEPFRERALAAIAASPSAVRRLVVVAEPVTNVDVTSADMLDELDRTLHASGIELCFAEVKGPVKDKLARFGLFSRLGERRFFRTVGADLGGMSTVQEVIAGRHMGMRCLCFSLVTNLASGVSPEPLNHEEVIEAGKAAASKVEGLLGALLRDEELYRDGD